MRVAGELHRLRELAVRERVVERIVGRTRGALGNLEAAAAPALGGKGLAQVSPREAHVRGGLRVDRDVHREGVDVEGVRVEAIAAVEDDAHLGTTQRVHTRT